MKKHNHRKILLCIFFVMLSAGIFLILKIFNDNIVFFLTTSEIYQTENKLQNTQNIRVGGLVKNGSVLYIENGKGVTFTLTDNKQDLNVIYYGVLPSLFKEGSGAVALGKMDYKQKIFHANEILAKHDENYKPITDFNTK